MDLLEAKQWPADSETRHPWETARLAVLRALIGRHIAFGDRSTVLDVGCGDGFVLSSLAAEFPRVLFYGVDPELSPDAISRYEAAGGHPNVRLLSSLGEFVEPPGDVSLVLLTDVLEHVNDDEAFLATLRDARFTDSRTRFVITVPAYQALWSPHDVLLRHYRRYSIETLSRCVTRAGFEITETGSFFVSLLTIRALGVLLQRLLPARPAQVTGLASWQGGRTMSRVLARVLIADAAFAGAARRLGVRVPGLSNYVVCRKSV